MHKNACINQVINQSSMGPKPILKAMWKSQEAERNKEKKCSCPETIEKKATLIYKRMEWPNFI